MLLTITKNRQGRAGSPIPLSDQRSARATKWGAQSPEPWLKPQSIDL